MSNLISGTERSTIAGAMQASQDDIRNEYSGDMYSQYAVRVSAQIGYMNGQQPVIEERFDLALPSTYSRGSAIYRQPRLNSAAKLLGEAMRLAQLIQQFVDDRGRLVWVTIQTDLNRGQSVCDYTATAYYDDNACPKTLSQIRSV